MVKTEGQEAFARMSASLQGLDDDIRELVRTISDVPYPLSADEGEPAEAVRRLRTAVHQLERWAARLQEEVFVEQPSVELLRAWANEVIQASQAEDARQPDTVSHFTMMWQERHYLGRSGSVFYNRAYLLAEMIRRQSMTALHDSGFRRAGIISVREALPHNSGVLACLSQMVRGMLKDVHEVLHYMDLAGVHL